MGDAIKCSECGETTREMLYWVDVDEYGRTVKGRMPLFCAHCGANLENLKNSISGWKIMYSTKKLVMLLNLKKTNLVKNVHIHVLGAVSFLLNSTSNLNHISQQDIARTAERG